MFIAKKLKDIKQTVKGLVLTEKRPTEWVITNKGNIVLYIPDYLQNPKEVAKGVAEILNKNRTIVVNFDL